MRPARLAAVILGLLALGFGVASWSLGYWIDGLPGPGLLPLGTSLLLLPAVVVLFRAPPEPDDEASLSPRSLAGIGMCGACALAMPWLGIALPGWALGLLWMRWFGARSWLAAGAAAALIIGALAGLFVVALKVPMPLWPGQ
jgi:hypothetical protein